MEVTESNLRRQLNVTLVKRKWRFAHFGNSGAKAGRVRGTRVKCNSMVTKYSSVVGVEEGRDDVQCEMEGGNKTRGRRKGGRRRKKAGGKWTKGKRKATASELLTRPVCLAARSKGRVRMDCTSVKRYGAPPPFRLFQQSNAPKNPRKARQVFSVLTGHSSFRHTRYARPSGRWLRRAGPSTSSPMPTQTEGLLHLT